MKPKLSLFCNPGNINMRASILTQKEQKGFSLISVLMGIVISISFLLMIQNFVFTSTKAQQFNAAQTSISEKGRYIISDLRRIVSAAGLEITDAVSQDAKNNNLAVVDGVAIVSTTSDSSDNLVIGALRDGGCSGKIGTDTTTAIKFTQIRVNNNNLQCRQGTSTSTLAGGYNTLSTNVYGLRVLYGIDVDNDGYPDSYRDDQNITNNEVRNIRAIRVGVLVGSGHGRVIAEGDGVGDGDYQLLGATITTTNTQGKLIRPYETTVYLRNLSDTVVRF